MRTIMTMLIASIMLAGTPFALAAHRCDHNPGSTSEGIAFPGKEGHYLFLDPSQPEKIGEWIEDNGYSGLQTRACFALGSYRFGSDEQVAILP